MLSQSLLSESKGPTDESMDKKKQGKEKKYNRKNNDCCPRLFSRSNDNDPWAEDDNYTQLKPLNTPASKSMEAKKTTTTNDDCCSFLRGHNSYHIHRRMGGRSYPSMSYKDYPENYDKPTQQKQDGQKQDNSHQQQDPIQSDHQDNLSTVEYRHMDTNDAIENSSVKYDADKNDGVVENNISARIG